MPTEVKAQNTTTLASVKAIYDAADQANTLLDGMQTAATAAGTTLDGIYQDAADAQTAADDAQASADSASEYAARALGNLSTVQNITETLNWITAHGTMTLTSDVALDPTHVYFVVDAGGDYVVGGTHYSVVTEPDVDDISTYYELSIDESLNNYVATHLAVDTEGLWIIPDAGGNKVLIATGSGSTYTTAGTYIVGKVGGVDTVLAEFTASGSTIGQAASGNYAVLDDDSFYVYHENTKIAHFGYSNILDAPYYTIGERLANSSSGSYSVAEGKNTTASGIRSHAEGTGSTASGGDSHAEGYSTTASGEESHAEGYSTTASGNYSHAEGQHSTASGDVSHAEGFNSTAGGLNSHAQNLATKASGNSQTALGKYNVEDTADTYAVIVGNGTDYNARSNALTVDWSGNVEAAGDVTDGAGNTLSAIVNALFYKVNDTITIDGRFAGICTGGSASMQLYVPLQKSMANITTITVTSAIGGIRISTGGYADNVGDSGNWIGRSGITVSAAKYHAGIIVTISKTSAFKQNATTTNVVNNTPVVYGGKFDLKFT